MISRHRCAWTEGREEVLAVIDELVMVHLRGDSIPNVNANTVGKNGFTPKLVTPRRCHCES